jgi:hypothetical protein
MTNRIEAGIDFIKDTPWDQNGKFNTERNEKNSTKTGSNIIPRRNKVDPSAEFVVDIDFQRILTPGARHHNKTRSTAPPFPSN